MLSTSFSIGSCNPCIIVGSSVEALLFERVYVVSDGVVCSIVKRKQFVDYYIF